MSAQPAAQCHGSAASDSGVECFWRCVDKLADDGCWVWTAARNSAKYGQVRFRGRQCSAHRVSWELANGLIPDGLQVRHKCDNTACVRPDHLFLGTQRDNNLDCINKGRSRQASGENNGRAKLTNEQARTIYQRVWSGERTVDLAREYSIRREAIGKIKHGHTYALATQTLRKARRHE